MKVNLGGDRLGSGNKMPQYLKNYGRSTHNLSQNWASSMAPGVLYPFLCLPAMRGDKFEIDLEAACRTIPTKGPLFGSYKMQLDVFQYPVRLAQALLHNNPLNLGRNMDKVMMPTLKLSYFYPSAEEGRKSKFERTKINNTALLKYLGLSGIGMPQTGPNPIISREINAVPAIAYYDIFKNYYANKQEEYAYVIGVKSNTATISPIYTIIGGGNTTKDGYLLYFNGTSSVNFLIHVPKGTTWQSILDMEIILECQPDSETNQNTLKNLINSGSAFVGVRSETNGLDTYPIIINGQSWASYQGLDGNPWSIELPNEIQDTKIIQKLHTYAFELANIDDFRMKILSWHQLGVPFSIEEDHDDAGIWGTDSGRSGDGLPYSALIRHTFGNAESWNNYPMNGLCLKTYQSDLFNNWLDTEWIDGESGISAITAVNTTGGSFTIDSLILAEKLYDLYNRVAVSGGTYEDWQNVVWQEIPRMNIEAPIYLGGMSNEVVFEEIVQSAPAELQDGTSQLGTLGGRGTLIKRKGGKIIAKVSEASFIIGIISLTPRVYYTQGNEFYLTELKSINDFHKPQLDAIGFQNLIGERLAWWDTEIPADPDEAPNRSVIGKLPAWIEYMTAVDKAYGDFADETEEGKNFMILSRRYSPTDTFGQIEDATTYIDPSKFNYAFAYTELEAQNFWVQIRSNIKARRIMSAKQMPSL